MTLINTYEVFPVFEQDVEYRKTLNSEQFCDRYREVVIEQENLRTDREYTALEIATIINTNSCIFGGSAGWHVYVIIRASDASYTEVHKG